MESPSILPPGDPELNTVENRMLLAVCVRHLIEKLGMVGILWGVINLIGALWSVSNEPIYWGLALLGILMIVTGLRSMIVSSLDALWWEAVIAAQLAVWNLAFTFYQDARGEDSDFWQAAAMFAPPIYLGLKYRSLRPLRDWIDALSKESITQIKRACREILRKSLKNDLTISRTMNGLARVKLLPDRAFFVEKDLERAFTASRTAVRAAVRWPKEPRWHLDFHPPYQGPASYYFSMEGTERIRRWLLDVGQDGAITRPQGGRPYRPCVGGAEDWL